MATMRRVPPGRAGRLWLTHRLSVATRAADLLDRKARVLRREAERYALLCERTGATWAVTCRDAQRWGLRAGLVGGQGALRAVTGDLHAQVTVTWKSTMGVGIPEDPRCHLPEPPAGVVPGPATSAAVDAYRRALAAAVEHAAVLAGSRALEAELAATRHRLRAVTDRWVPLLESALAARTLALEESDRAEGVGLRWALRRTPARDGPA